MKKTDTTEKFEREYNIPLREKTKFAPRYKKTKKAIRTVKEFLVKHMKIRDRDLRKIKIDKYLNEAMWSRGIRHPPHHIKVKATFENGIVRAELVEYPQNLKFKKLREEKIKQKAKAVVESKKGLMEKAKETFTQTKEKPEETAKAEETKEKEKTSAVAEQMIEKELAKEEKHMEKIKPKIEEKSRQKKVYNKSSRGH